jgi:hypothetical protein
VAHPKKKGKLRIVVTSYMGAADPEARIGDGTEPRNLANRRGDEAMPFQPIDRATLLRAIGPSRYKIVAHRVRRFLPYLRRGT